MNITIINDETAKATNNIRSAISHLQLVEQNGDADTANLLSSTLHDLVSALEKCRTIGDLPASPTASIEEGRVVVRFTGERHYAALKEGDTVTWDAIDEDGRIHSGRLPRYPAGTLVKAAEKDMFDSTTDLDIPLSTATLYIVGKSGWGDRYVYVKQNGNVWRFRFSEGIWPQWFCGFILLTPIVFGLFLIFLIATGRLH